MIDLRFQPMKERPAAKHRYYKASPFKAKLGLDELERELKLLKATDIVIESGHDRMQIRNDGWPRGGSSPAHQDVRLFFHCKHGQLRYECNMFDTWEANLRAIGLWIQRQRLAIEEWGIGTGGEAYRGFAALPPPGGLSAPEWASVDQAVMFLLATRAPEASITTSMIEGALKNLDLVYRDAAKKAHPDTGGSEELMSKVNRAKAYIEEAA